MAAIPVEAMQLELPSLPRRKPRAGRDPVRTGSRHSRTSRATASAKRRTCYGAPVTALPAIPRSGFPVQAGLERCVVLFVDRYREVHVAAVGAALEERPTWERVGAIRRTTVDTDQPTQIAESLTARERP